MKLYSIIILLLITNTLKAGEVKLKKVTEKNGKESITYYVLKKDKTIKQGAYLLKNRDLKIKGQYLNNNKSGLGIFL